MATELTNEAAGDDFVFLANERKRLSAEISRLELERVKIIDEWYPSQVQKLREKVLEKSVFSRGMSQIKEELRQRKVDNVRQKQTVQAKLVEINSKLRVHGQKLNADAAYRKSQQEAKPNEMLLVLKRIEALLIRVVERLESKQKESSREQT